MGPTGKVLCRYYLVCRGRPPLAPVIFPLLPHGHSDRHTRAVFCRTYLVRQSRPLPTPVESYIHHKTQNSKTNTTIVLQLLD